MEDGRVRKALTLRYRDVGLWGLTAWLILGRVSFALPGALAITDSDGTERALVLFTGAVALVGLLLGLLRSILWAFASLATLAFLAAADWLLSRPRPSGNLLLALACLGATLILAVAPKPEQRGTEP